MANEEYEFVFERTDDAGKPLPSFSGWRSALAARRRAAWVARFFYGARQHRGVAAFCYHCRMPRDLTTWASADFHDSQGERTGGGFMLDVCRWCLDRLTRDDRLASLERQYVACDWDGDEERTFADYRHALYAQTRDRRKPFEDKP